MALPSLSFIQSRYSHIVAQSLFILLAVVCQPVGWLAANNTVMCYSSELWNPYADYYDQLTTRSLDESGIGIVVISHRLSAADQS